MVTKCGNGAGVRGGRMNVREKKGKRKGKKKAAAPEAAARDPQRWGGRRSPLASGSSEENPAREQAVPHI